MECEKDSLLDKLLLGEYVKGIQDELLALDIEYFKICGKCGERDICTYLNVVVDQYQCRLRVLSTSISLPANTIVDDQVFSLFKYSNSIKRTGDTINFYISREHLVGVYYMYCSGNTVKWLTHAPVDYEEVLELSDLE